MRRKALCKQLCCGQEVVLDFRWQPPAYSLHCGVVLCGAQDGNKDLSETLYKMLVAGERAPSLSAANAAIKGSKTIDEALVCGVLLCNVYIVYCLHCRSHLTLRWFHPI